MKKVLVIDTSVFCVWLQLPGYEACGSDNDRWDYERVKKKIEEEVGLKTTLILPLATIIETGNHISQLAGDRYTHAHNLCNILLKSIDNEDPWAAFSEQNLLWTDDNVRRLATDWPLLASQKISIGDATIKDVADYYSKSGYDVEIFTGDNGLKSYEPAKPVIRPIPRRRK